MNYLFKFNPIRNNYSHVLVQKSEEQSFTFTIGVDYSNLISITCKKSSSFEADFMDLALAIHFVDKFAKPIKANSLEIFVELPLRNALQFNRFKENIQNIRDHFKAVHPRSLNMMGKFISSIIEEEFSICNPFIFHTKAEMCRLSTENISTIFETVSCDKWPHERYRQCGYCTSCILRKQAIYAADLEDRTKYVVPHHRIVKEEEVGYWQLVNQQICYMKSILDSERPWLNWCEKYPELLLDVLSQQLGNNVDIKRHLLELYRTHIWEWEFVSTKILHDIKHETHAEEEKWQAISLIP